MQGPGSGAPIAVLLDYDGTISLRDVGDELMRRFVPDQAAVGAMDARYVAGEVGSLNTLIQHKSGNGDATAAPTTADARDVSETALALSARAEALATKANEAEFEELATQAHSLHQRLQAIGKKLAKAAT